MPGSFTSKQLDVTFKLGRGAFGDNGADTVKLTGKRVACMILKAGGQSMGEMQLRIWGLSLDVMNKLSTLGMVAQALRNNQVQVEAGDSETGMAVVFTGTITNAWADFQAMPDVSFHVSALAGMYQAMKPVPPTSFAGGADVGVIMSGLASQMNLAFENNGVQARLPNPYFPGTAREQAARVAEHAGIEWVIDLGTLAIWPRGQSRRGLIPRLTPSNGLIGYPTFTSNGIAVTAIYVPGIGFGGRIKVESSLKPANGEWIVRKLVYDLSSALPKGNWLMYIEANPPGFAPVR